MTLTSDLRASSGRQVRVRCCWCRGAGDVTHPGLTAALDALLRGARTSNDVAKAMGISANGACNLLARLERMGRARRLKRERGKGFVWMVA